MARLRAPQRREQLIRAAATVFAKFGYDGATTAAIAAAAEVTEPVLYRHFEGKQALFAAIVQKLLLDLTARWDQLTAASEDPTEQLRLSAHQYAQAVADWPDSYRVLNGAILTCQDPVVLSLIRDYYRTTEAQVAAMLRRGQTRGVFRTDMDAGDLAWVMIDMGIGYAIQETKLFPGRTRPELFVEAVAGALRPR